MSSSPSVPGSEQIARRVLVIDDNPSIHKDFRKILCPGSPATGKRLEALEASLFGARRSVSGAPLGRPGSARASALEFTVDFASQGQEGLGAVRRMTKAKTPYALVFVDMRMPPGWDGVETAVHIWQEDPAIQSSSVAHIQTIRGTRWCGESTGRGFVCCTSRSTPRTCSIWRGR
jgi:CheY-like chemotaxis protein